MRSFDTNDLNNQISELPTRLILSQLPKLPSALIQRFHVCPDGAYYGLSLESSGIVFSIFSRKTCEELKHLLSEGPLRLEAYGLDINIYGARDDAQQVGKKLSSLGLTLQQPLYGLDDVTYYNPHFLHVQELFGHYVAETPRLDLRAVIPLSSSKQDAIPEEPKAQVDADTEVDSILNSLSHHTVLHKHTIEGLKTPLKDHQMEAIDFILRREIGKLPPELTLWKELELDSGEAVYQHVISGTRRQIPAESKGGIIADEMGLGKTMVALSVISASTDRASKFASENLQSDGEQSSQRPSKATLVIVPSSLLIDGWVDEIHKHIYPGYLSYHKYHGPNREAVDEIFLRDIVFTTYATVVTEISSDRNTLSNVRWFRIVLDEAHEIRNRGTRQFQVVARLTAQYRWCLTGTPIQNSLDDLGALVSFVRVPLLDDPATFRRFIVNESNTNTRERFKNLRILLGSICLRRTKDIVNLSDPTEQTRELEFTPSEREEYNSMLFKCRTRIDTYVSTESKGLNSAMLQSLLQLRLYCNHGIIGQDTTSYDPDEVLSYLQQIDQAVCVYCSRTIYSINDVPGTYGGSILSSCSHLVCRDCHPKHESRQQVCPQCTSGNRSSSIQQLLQDMRPIGPDSVEFNQGIKWPTKLRAFLEDIQQQATRKSIVFSSWKKTLDLVGDPLKSNNLLHYTIHGSLSLEERRRVLREFQAHGRANILLMTLGTGAVGLNLAVATRIYLLEPQWNPSVEKQAFGRAIRLGQTEQVTIIRYIMKDTIEDSNVLSRQANKLRLASGGFQQQSKGSQSNRVEALRRHFGFPEPASHRPSQDRLSVNWLVS
ncbi:SNF2 family N-terminal domain-containing protein [Hypoxylon sp. NC1633]|nr:SNF2 family N-terminal domain-containing protein [Hypoxylon sp. NC1633]